MAESVEWRSPLQVEAWASGWPNLIVRDDVVLREMAFVSQVDVRVEPGSEAAARVAQALGVALPTTPNATATNGIRTALWLAPAEWLVVGPPDDASAMETLVREALAEVQASGVSTRGAPGDVRAAAIAARGAVVDVPGSDAGARGGRGVAWGSVVDVSANRTVLELSGPAARDGLSLGCPLDLHARVFASGACAQTLLAKANVILWQRDDAPTYWIFVRASFATYLADWFARAVPDRL